jgi:hypothetical protein
MFFTTNHVMCELIDDYQASCYYHESSSSLETVGSFFKAL